MTKYCLRLGPGTKCAAYFILSILAIYVYLISVTMDSFDQNNILLRHSSAKKYSFVPFLKLNPVVNERTIYEVPRGNPKGIVFLAHACTHGAYDFWPPSEHCSHCTGLAEEVLISRTAINSGYIVIAVNSSDRSHGCWGQSSSDVEYVKSAIYSLREKYHLFNVPLFAIGASSGSSFVWNMACRGEVDGVILQVLPVDTNKYHSSVGFRTSSGIPIAFNPMKRDLHTYKGMYANFEQLLKFVDPALLKFQECSPIPITATYLLSRLPFLELYEAENLVKELKDFGHLNKSTGYLIIDPTSKNSNWRDVIKFAATQMSLQHPLVLEMGKSPFAKTLNRAWAYHEYCVTYIKEDLEWMYGQFLQKTSVY